MCVIEIVLINLIEMSGGKGQWVVAQSIPNDLMCSPTMMPTEEELRQTLAEDIAAFGEDAAPTLMAKSSLAARVLERDAEVS